LPAEIASLATKRWNFRPCGETRIYQFTIRQLLTLTFLLAILFAFLGWLGRTGRGPSALEGFVTLSGPAIVFLVLIHSLATYHPRFHGLAQISFLLIAVLASILVILGCLLAALAIVPSTLPWLTSRLTG
jgi:hypothetical protein